MALFALKGVPYYLFDYADIMVGCAGQSKLDKSERLQEMALRYVNNEVGRNVDIDKLYVKYNVQRLPVRYKEHISCFMYRQSKICVNLELSRPNIYLRSNNKVKFKKVKQRKLLCIIPKKS